MTSEASNFNLAESGAHGVTRPTNGFEQEATERAELNRELKLEIMVRRLRRETQMEAAPKKPLEGKLYRFFTI